MLSILVTTILFAFSKETGLEVLIGKWQAIGYLYQEHFIQPPDPQLLLTFEFFPDGTDILYWKNKKEDSFCERYGKWHVKDNLLIDEIVGTNPNNGWDCGGDPDMEIGRINESEFWREDGKLHTVIPLGDEFIVYVWIPVLPLDTDALDASSAASPL